MSNEKELDIRNRFSVAIALAKAEGRTQVFCNGSAYAYADGTTAPTLERALEGLATNSGQLTPKWNPLKEPFRVTYTFRGSQYPSGWLSRVVDMFPTLEAAIEVAKKKFPPGVSEVDIDQAYGVNENGWIHFGSVNYDCDTRSGWKRRAFRKSRQELKMSRSR